MLYTVCGVVCAVSFAPGQFHIAFGGKQAFDYQQLERRHDYIQWLFPSPER